MNLCDHHVLHSASVSWNHTQMLHLASWDRSDRLNFIAQAQEGQSHYEGCSSFPIWSIQSLKDWIFQWNFCGRISEVLQTKPWASIEYAKVSIHAPDRIFQDYQETEAWVSNPLEVKNGWSSEKKEHFSINISLNGGVGADLHGVTLQGAAYVQSSVSAWNRYCWFSLATCCYSYVNIVTGLWVRPNGQEGIWSLNVISPLFYAFICTSSIREG